MSPHLTLLQFFDNCFLFHFHLFFFFHYYFYPAKRFLKFAITNIVLFSFPLSVSISSSRWWWAESFRVQRMSRPYWPAFNSILRKHGLRITRTPMPATSSTMLRPECLRHHQQRPGQPARLMTTCITRAVRHHQTKNGRTIYVKRRSWSGRTKQKSWPAIGDVAD